MCDAEWDEFLKLCGRELAEKQQRIAPLYDGGSFHYDLSAERLELGTSAFHVSVIGTYCISQATWLWGWANDSFPEHTREIAAGIKGLYERTGFRVFLDPGVRATRTDAQNLVAMAIHHTGGLGFFRSVEDDRLLYLCLDSQIE